MTTLINIEGVLINLDGVIAIEWIGSGMEGRGGYPLRFQCNVADNAEGVVEHIFEDAPSTRAAYEWLKTTCVATFHTPLSSDEIPPVSAGTEPLIADGSMWFYLSSNAPFSSDVPPDDKKLHATQGPFATEQEALDHQQLYIFEHKVETRRDLS